MDKYFVPKVDDTTLLKLPDTINIPAAIIEAPNLLWRKNVAPELMQRVDRVFINPLTNRINYDVTKNYLKLPYYIAPSDIRKIYDDSSFRLHNFTTPSLNFQISNSASVLIAPYLYADDTSHPNLQLNLELISNSIKFIEKENLDAPLFIYIHITKNILKDDNLIRFIKGIYLDEFDEHISGIILSINGLEDKKAEIDELLGLVKLVKGLSLTGKELIVQNVGAFGSILLLFGATAYSCGLASAETHSVDNWDSANKSRGRHGFTYIPEILGYLHDDELSKINYKCSCVICNGKTPNNETEKKLHFYTHRQGIASKLNDMTFEEQYDFLKNLIKDSKKTAFELNSKYSALIRNTSYYDRWLTVLELAKDLDSMDEKEKDLEKLLLDEIDGL